MDRGRDDVDLSRRSGIACCSSGGGRRSRRGMDEIERGRGLGDENRGGFSKRRGSGKAVLSVGRRFG